MNHAITTTPRSTGGSTMHPLKGLFLLVLLVTGARQVSAAESYDNCAGFIDTLPATISTQGVWCLRHDLATAITSGDAITIDANNVTLDCNGYKVGGLAGGPGTWARGVYVPFPRVNATVRNCNVRGFWLGLFLFGDRHLVERNRLDANTFVGISSHGNGIVIRANAVNDTGGMPDERDATAIEAQGAGTRVLDNSIHGVAPAGWPDGQKRPIGILIERGIAQGNRITGLAQNGIQPAVGIAVGTDGRAIVRGNVTMQYASTVGLGIGVSPSATAICQDNVVQGYQYGITAACEQSGNLVQP
jgi:hypothetical protein